MISSLRPFLFLSLGACAVVSPKSPGTLLRPGQEIDVPAQFLAPDAATFEHDCQRDIAHARTFLESLTERKTSPEPGPLLKDLQKMWQAIDRTANAAALLRNVHPDKDVRAKAEICERTVSELTTEIGMSQALYAQVRALRTEQENEETKRLVLHLLRDFKRAGVDRDEATRARIQAIRAELVTVGQSFERNIREKPKSLLVKKESLRGLPEDYVQAHAPDADGNIELTCDYPDYLPIMSYAEDDETRRKLYLLFRQRGAPENDSVLLKMLALREELAALLGFSSWADYTTQDKMIKSAKHARTFIDDIATRAHARSDKDYQELLREKQKEDPKATEVFDWQKTFYEERVRRTRYDLDAQKVRQFFPFGRVRQGIFDVTGKLFNVSYTRVPSPSWHPSVEAYELRDPKVLIGRFYLDLHPRADKYKHAAAFPLVSGIQGVQLPEAALVCNFPAGEDALLEHGDVETFFHEFGHLLHHLFAGHVQWIGQSGIATEWDFVEAPSQMLEEWAFDFTTLSQFARRADKTVIDKKLVDQMRSARNFGKGLWVRQQMFYAALSLGLHETPTQDLSIGDFSKNLQAKYSPFAYVPDTRFELSFGHLEGYSAIYYTYMWSLVIAKDLLQAFTLPPGRGLLDTDVASRYRESVLAPGGTRDASDLVEAFLGRKGSADAFTEWLEEN